MNYQRHENHTYECPVCKQPMSWETAKRVKESDDTVFGGLIILTYLAAIVIAALWVLT